MSILDRAREAIANARTRRGRTITVGPQVWIYFIANMQADAIKIGTAIDIEARLASIKTCNHQTISLVYYFRSFTSSEKILYQHFREEAIRGEWFRYTDQIDELIEAIDIHCDANAGDGMCSDYPVQPDEIRQICKAIKT